MNSSMTLSYAPPAQEQLLEALIRLEQHLLGVGVRACALPQQRW